MSSIPRIILYLEITHNLKSWSKEHLATFAVNQADMSRVTRKPVFVVYNQVRCRQGVQPATEDGLRLENSDLGRRRFVLSM